MSSAASHESADHDVVVIGAGFAGLYAVHKFRDELGLDVVGIDVADGVGGTWYWNRYPAARCDVESIHYSYSFSAELQREWTWSERFAAQPEILRYLNHVADRFDLRRSFVFGRRVIALVWDDANARWTVTTDDGARRTAQFVIAGTGPMSIPKDVEIVGIEKFAGEVYTTGNWPHEGVDFTGKRVAVIGTGASGIQAIPAIAEQAGSLTVFQRTPNYAVPLRNRPSNEVEVSEVKAKYREMREEARNSFPGWPYRPPAPSVSDVTPQARREILDTAWQEGGFAMLLSTFGDLLFSQETNDYVAAYIRDRIDERVKDPATAALLKPTTYPYGTKRPPMETDYYETFNRDNAELIDLRSSPIHEVTRSGIRTSAAEHQFDIIVLATGFDAFTGALTRLGIVGRNGLSLNEAWVDGPHTYLGIASHGFPNLFMIVGPQSAIALYNAPLAIEDHVDFAADAIHYIRENGFAAIEPTTVAQDTWVRQVNGLAEASLLLKADSHYIGANVVGKPRVPLIYIGGAVAYRAFCADVVARGYDGFSFEKISSPVA